ncbi:MAG: Lrp/AsnC family transcriptional regulator [Burkholderiaceae bacterium]|nr:Lrp/AsnC family transcriptional regulator [Burkholderiaceae bacterium]
MAASSDPHRPLDRIDALLLAELQRDARQTVQQLAERVGLSSTPCWKRIKALEECGAIQRYTVALDRARVGLAQVVMAEINLARHGEEVVQQFEQAVADCPQITGCWATTGAADYIVQVLVPDIAGYEQWLHRVAFKLPGVTHVRSSVVLKEVKAGTPLPITVAAQRAR